MTPPKTGVNGVLAVVGTDGIEREVMIVFDDCWPDGGAIAVDAVSIGDGCVPAADAANVWASVADSSVCCVSPSEVPVACL